MNTQERNFRSLIRQQLREALSKKNKSKSCEPSKFRNDLETLRYDAENLSHAMSEMGCEALAQHVERAIDALDAALEACRGKKQVDPMSEPSKI